MVADGEAEAAPRRSNLSRAFLVAIISQLVNLAYIFIVAAILHAIEKGPQADRNAAAVADFQLAETRRADLLTSLRAELSGKPGALAKLDAFASEMSDLAGGEPQAEENWSYIGAVYFAYTVSTTIGYGTFAPSTDGGRVATVLLAVPGIVVFALSITLSTRCLGASTERLGRAFLKDRYEANKVKWKSFINFWIFAWVFAGGGVLYSDLMHEESDYHIAYGHAIYCVAITYLTIGLGDFSIPWTGDRKVFSVLLFISFTFLGLLCVADMLNTLGSCVEDHHQELKVFLFPPLSSKKDDQGKDARSHDALSSKKTSNMQHGTNTEIWSTV